MSTVNVNPSVNQSVCGNCGGASGLSAALNAIGKWGTVLTATAQGKPVATRSVSVGAAGSQTLGGALTGNSLLLILVIVGVLIFMATKK